MKTKKIGKTLTLNKKTIAHLDNGELNAIQGGVLLPTEEGWSCAYCTITTETYTCFTCHTCVPCPTRISKCDACLETEPISACC